MVVGCLCARKQSVWWSCEVWVSVIEGRQDKGKDKNKGRRQDYGEQNYINSPIMEEYSSRSEQVN